MSDQIFVDALKHAIDRVVHEAVGKAANEAAEKARADVLAKVGQIATSVLAEYSMHRDGKDLVIRVKIG